jgi:hypothetical protein
MLALLMRGKRNFYWSVPICWAYPSFRPRGKGVIIANVFWQGKNLEKSQRNRRKKEEREKNIKK